MIKYKDKFPQIGKDVFIAQGARIIGDVNIGDGSSIWFNAVLRGDVDLIKIGENTNIQDNSVIHTSRFNGPAIIGDNVTVGHSALLHACKIDNYGFIGMGSIVLDGVIVESYGFVAAGALVTPGKIVKSHELWAGRPAKLLRTLTFQEIEMIRNSAEHYKKLALDYS